MVFTKRHADWKNKPDTSTPVNDTDLEYWEQTLADHDAAITTNASGVSTHTANTANPHAVTKAQVGLGNVDNTADTAKPVSTAQQTALDLKAPLASPAFTGTPTGITKSHVGLGSVDNTADTAKPVSTAQQAVLDLKAPLASPTFTGTVSGVTKSHVGLGNVDNTADTAKPVSTAQQTALDLKAPLASPTFTGTVAGVTKGHVGLGNVDNTADVDKPVSTATTTAITAAKPSEWTPADMGFKSWAFDPVVGASTQLLATAGVLYGHRLKLDTAQTITNICICVATAGSGLTSGQCGVALYQNNTLLAQSADISTVVNSAGYKVIALSAPQACTAGFIDVVIWYNGTTAPTLTRAASQASNNAGLTGTALRSFNANTGVTTTASSPLGTKGNMTQAIWFAVS